MHLLLENVAPNLIKLWISEFKGLDTGTEDYKLSGIAWQQIGREMKEATQSIPSAFVQALGNIAEDCSLFTAESWCFWFLHLALILLHGHFKKEKYYIHACDFVCIMKLSLWFTLTTNDVDKLGAQIISWHNDLNMFNSYYYQNCEECLPTCTLMIHGFLHIASNIHNCGPVWATWTFFMEQMCEVLQMGLHSHVQPWANLNKRLLHMTYLSQLSCHYDVEEELLVGTQDIPGKLDTVTCGEKLYKNCE
ncbi:hypothetical protein BDN71DRAFT_1396437 [Pleurotus eryngii]|uniref:Uncharacterized protein n=1 Tax=Pleurotus eryngii TaxID=5323 RepID=A0A9P5ZQX1_PLEER|nr:hypothetical protein BDN71DRAFT_1396437 [Pleurotus eryngii]